MALEYFDKFDSDNLSQRQMTSAMQGCEVDVEHTIFVMTSTIGSQKIKGDLSKRYESVKDRVETRLYKCLGYIPLLPFPLVLPRCACNWCPLLLHMTCLLVLRDAVIHDQKYDQLSANLLLQIFLNSIGSA